MVFRILLYVSLMFVVVLVGRSGKLRSKILNKLDLIQLICLLFLLFAMGISMGTNEKVMSSFSTIGLKSAAFAVFSIIFSVFFVLIFNKLLTLTFSSKNDVQKAGEGFDI